MEEQFIHLSQESLVMLLCLQLQIEQFVCKSKDSHNVMVMPLEINASIRNNTCNINQLNGIALSNYDTLNYNLSNLNWIKDNSNIDDGMTYNFIYQDYNALLKNVYHKDAYVETINNYTIIVSAVILNEYGLLTSLIISISITLNHNSIGYFMGNDDFSACLNGLRKTGHGYGWCIKYLFELKSKGSKTGLNNDNSSDVVHDNGIMESEFAADGLLRVILNVKQRICTTTLVILSPNQMSIIDNSNIGNSTFLISMIIRIDEIRGGTIVNNVMTNTFAIINKKYLKPCDTDPCDCNFDELCNIYHSKKCDECISGYFEVDYNFECISCSEYFGANCLLWQDFSTTSNMLCISDAISYVSFRIYRNSCLSNANIRTNNNINYWIHSSSQTNKDSNSGVVRYYKSSCNFILQIPNLSTGLYFNDNDNHDVSWKDFKYVDNISTDTYTAMYELTGSWDNNELLLMKPTFCDCVLDKFTSYDVAI